MNHHLQIEPLDAYRSPKTYGRKVSIRVFDT
jgi:hypothetical protein